MSNDTGGAPDGKLSLPVATCLATPDQHWPQTTFTMDLLPWFPALTTTAVLASALWLARELISTRLTRTVQHDFDRKIEAVKADLRNSEERFKALLREKEAELAALRSGALSVLASRHAALDKRRLEAVDQLWSAMNALAPARAVAANMSVINFDVAAKGAERDPKIRQFFESISQGFDMRSIDLSGAAKAQPFVSPMVWAVYSAIRAVTMHSVLRLQVLRGGLGTKDFADHKAIEKLVVAALPHYSEYLEKNGPDVHYFVLEALDSKLLAELRGMLSGAESDKNSLEQAAEIIRQANALQAETQLEESQADTVPAARVRTDSPGVPPASAGP